MNNDFSILVLTYNEERNLAECLRSLALCRDIVVLDSFSSDGTQRIAKEHNVRFYQRKFDNFASQRSYGLNEIHFDNRWVLFVDADERATPELLHEISQQLSESDDETCLFRLRRKDFFMGRWIKRSSGYPTWFGRLVRRGCVRVEREVNEEYVTDGKVGFLFHHLEHYPFAKGLSHWLDKHNRYSSMEAGLLYGQGINRVGLASYFHRDPAERRRAIKNLVYRMPFRPILMFVALYVLRGGMLDGRAGLTFCLLRSYYEFMIDSKVRELQFVNCNSRLVD